MAPRGSSGSAPTSRPINGPAEATVRRPQPGSAPAAYHTRPSGRSGAARGTTPRDDGSPTRPWTLRPAQPQLPRTTSDRPPGRPRPQPSRPAQACGRRRSPASSRRGWVCASVTFRRRGCVAPAQYHQTYLPLRLKQAVLAFIDQPMSLSRIEREHAFGDPMLVRGTASTNSDLRSWTLSRGCVDPTAERVLAIERARTTLAVIYV